MTSGNPPVVSSTRQTTWRFILGLLVKAGLLFVALNILWAWLKPLPVLDKLSLYNTLFPGRLRFSFGDNPEKSYSLSILQPNALLASHEIEGSPASPDEFRLILVGDSSVWGYLQRPDETLAAVINQAGWITPDGRRVRAYNFGYPTLGVVKDLLFLDRAFSYQPDMIVWFVTLESMPWTTQLDAPLLQYNPALSRQLIDRYDLPLDPSDERFVEEGFWRETIVGQRREIADWLRLQLYGVMWAGTGIDHEIPDTYNPRMEDLEDDPGFHGFMPGQMTAADLAFEALQSGITAAGETPVVIVNEPIFISGGANSDVRYNFYYPRWAYDLYRDELNQMAEQRGWKFVDLWDALAGDHFTDSAIHYTPEGVQQVIEWLRPILLEWAVD
ncbi:MAG: SGNH/GDSL hydrolase family protein [Anaerolineales bacterium]|jgi:hypothetical protein